MPRNPFFFFYCEGKGRGMGEGVMESEGDRQMETEKPGRSLHRHHVQKEPVSPDKIIWLFSATLGGDMPFTWRGVRDCECLRLCVNYVLREKGGGAI